MDESKKIFIKSKEDLQEFFGTKEWNRMLNRAKTELFLRFDLENMDSEITFNTYINMLVSFIGNSVSNLIKSVHGEARRKELLLYAKEAIIETLMDITAN